MIRPIIVGHTIRSGQQTCFKDNWRRTHGPNATDHASMLRTTLNTACIHGGTLRRELDTASPLTSPRRPECMQCIALSARYALS